MVYDGRQLDRGAAPRRPHSAPPTRHDAPVLVEPWQQRRAPQGQPPPTHATHSHTGGARRAKRPAAATGRPRRGRYSAGHTYARKVWQTGRGKPARRRRRRRKSPLPPILLCLCLALVVLGVARLFSGGRNAPVEPTEYDDIANTVVTPHNGETFVLALDAGHGGDDPGALSPDESIYESTVTREMLDRVYALFAARQPDAVQLVVSTEAGASVHSRKERAEVANNAGADLFLSLHLNSDAKSSVNGFQAYAQPPGSTHNARSVQFAEILAAQVGEKTGLKLIGGSGVYYMFYEDTYTAYPYEYTSAINSAHAAYDTYGVLQHATCPAVLIEQWYITNAGDMAAMYTDEGMNAMAECIYAAVCQYFGLQA